MGLILGGWLTWRLLENPQRAGAVMMGWSAAMVLVAVGSFIALQRKTVVWDDYPGKQASLEVEVSFPAAEIDQLGKADRLEFQMRSADGTKPRRAGAIR